MKAKKIWIILLTVLVFLSSAVLGVSSVYRIDEVTVVKSTISSAADAEAEELRTRLLAAYEKQFSPSAKADEAYAIVEDFPYFRITAVEKAYPNRLIVHVAEDDEVYAVPDVGGSGNYYILNKEGTVLGIRQDYNNRSDETGRAKNVLLLGLNVTGNKGEALGGDDALSYLFSVCAKVDERLQGIRRNVVSVEKVQNGGSLETVTLKLVTYEGVTIYIHTPSEKTEEKATVAIEKYFSLEDGERTRGMIAVMEVDGVVSALYDDKDLFAPIQ